MHHLSQAQKISELMDDFQVAMGEEISAFEKYRNSFHTNGKGHKETIRLSEEAFAASEEQEKVRQQLKEIGVFPIRILYQ